MKAVPLNLLIALLVIQMTSPGCESNASPAGLPTVQAQIGSRTYTLEVADTEPTRRKGLMKRDELPRDRGMLFVFPDEQPRSFWMLNTRIPLDILFLDAAGKVVSIHSMQPYDLRSTPSAGPAKYAIELNQGEAEASGIEVGDVIAIPQTTRPPTQ